MTEYSHRIAYRLVTSSHVTEQNFRGGKEICSYLRQDQNLRVHVGLGFRSGANI